MKIQPALRFASWPALFPSALSLFAAIAQPTNADLATPPVYVPDLSHANEPLPDGIIAWENPSQAIEAAADQGQGGIHVQLHEMSLPATSSS